MAFAGRTRENWALTGAANDVRRVVDHELIYSQLILSRFKR
jgi:hypothetical protein